MKGTDVLRAAALPLLSHAVPCACWPIVPGALLRVRKMCRDYGCLSASFYWKIKSSKRLYWVPQPPPSTSMASPTLEHLVQNLLTWSGLYSKILRILLLFFLVARPNLFSLWWWKPSLPLSPWHFPVIPLLASASSCLPHMFCWLTLL